MDDSSDEQNTDDNDDPPNIPVNDSQGTQFPVLPMLLPEVQRSQDQEEYDDNAPPPELVPEVAIPNDPDLLTPKGKRARTTIVSPDLAASLDRTKTSDRNATYVISSAIESVGLDPNDYTINRSSINRDRIKYRKTIAETVKGSFDPTVVLIVHWDGKMLPELTGKGSVDRLPILVSGLGVDQLLGVPKLPEGTGEAIASAVFDELENWAVSNRVKAMCFDTTSSNSGHKIGACVKLETKLGRHLLPFACRHHIFELILGACVILYLGPTSGPDMAIFKRFQAHWPFIDQSVFFPFSEPLKDDDVIIKFAKEHLQQFQPRDDYRELLELTIIILGGVPKRGVRFMVPGALHHARWMAKSIYCLKMYIFRNQFKLTDRESSGIFEICKFVVQVYVQVWYEAPRAMYAPRNDLRLLTLLSGYENSDIANVTVNKMLNHLWYLGDVLVALAFFDDRVSFETKRAMVKVMSKKHDENGNEHNDRDISMKRAVVLEKDIPSRNLEDFVTSNTYGFFEVLELPSAFLETNPNSWKDNDDYQKALATVSALKPINDSAERGVALMSEYNKLLTNNEEQKQYLLQVVSEHRKKIPSCKKSLICPK